MIKKSFHYNLKEKGETCIYFGL